MKKLITLLLILSTSYGFSQISFSVAPGLNLNSAQVGYKKGRFMPYISFQKLSVNGKFTESTSTSYSDPTYQGYESESDIEFKASVLLPSIGTRFYLSDNDKIATSLNIAYTRPIVWGKMIEDGSNNNEIQDEIEKFSLFGLNFGFSAEYYLDKKFSIFGEFGLIYIRGRYQDESKEEDYYTTNNNGETVYQTREEKYDYKLILSPTYSKVGINFYFNK